MWSPGLNAHRKSGSICAVLRRDSDHSSRGAFSEPAAKKIPPLDAHHAWLSEKHDDESDDVASPGAYRCLVTHWDEDAQEYRTSTKIRQYNSFDLQRSLTADLWDSFSPSSDTTLFEDPNEYYHSEDDGSINAYFSLDKTDDEDDGKHSIATHSIHAASDQDGAATPVQRPPLRDRRAATTDTPPETPRRQSMPLRRRSKTNTGILELQLGKTPTTAPAADKFTGKEPVTPAVQRHARKVSLGLPISIARPHTSPAQPTQRPWSPSTPTISERPERHERPERLDNAIETALVQEERELEYKHRHTFIGTASLDDFLEILEISPNHTTTRASVAKAFIFLVSAEHLHARQCSIKQDGWDLVSRITIDSSNSDYIAQAQTKLGAVTLKQFLDLIPFDDKGEVGALSVVGAFSAGSHMDAKASAGVGSKAGQFRKWMVKQMGIGA